MSQATPRGYREDAMQSNVTNEEQGFRLEQDAHFQFSEGCDRGDPTACYSLGQWHAVVKKDHASANAIYLENCKSRNHASSCFNYAINSAAGRGFDDKKERVAEGFEFTKKACDLGHVQACDVLGANIMQGHGCKKDAAAALKVWEKACEAQYPPSCFRLGAFYLAHYKRHEGYDKDPKRAELHMKAGCDLGHPTSCHTLATMYKKGERSRISSVDRDEALFLKYKELTEKLVGQAKMRFNASSGR